MPFFTNATDVKVTGGHFETHSQTYIHYHGPNGLQILLDSSLPEAAHDSSARDPPPSCLPGTRENYIKTITTWVRSHNVTTSIQSGSVSGHGSSLHKLLWVSGPAGVGKSAVAQTCAEALQESSELGAAFFFSIPNQRDDPTKLFTSIAYQLATRKLPATSPYGVLLEEDIRKDPSVVKKSLEVQLHQLIIDPVMDLLERSCMTRSQRVVVIVDGLDECRGHGTQEEILRLLANATLEYPELPLLWVVFSRPEPHIESAIAKFSSSWRKVVIPISEDTDDEIESYLRQSFATIQQRYNLSCNSTGWPSEIEIRALTRKSAGLFIYAATVVRFFDDPFLPEREQQLANLLSSQPPPASSSGSATTTPLSHLDAFYTLIMQRIPQSTLPYTLNILLILVAGLITSPMTVMTISNLLGYTASTTVSAFYALRSVLSLQNDLIGTGNLQDPENLKDSKIAFYHYSFLEFLRDADRSKDFCVFQPACRLFWAQRCLQILYEFNKGGLTGITLANTPFQDPEMEIGVQNNLLTEASCSLLESCARIPNLSDFPDYIHQFHSLDYRRIADAAGSRMQNLVLCLREEHLTELRKQLDIHQQKTNQMLGVLRERFSIVNSIARHVLSITHRFSSAVFTRAGSSSFTPSSTPSSSSASGLVSTSSEPPATSRLLSAYELGFGEKKVYLYPERASFGVMYHICTTSDELKEPYVLPGDNSQNY
ncbi:hypothetical protein P691DRAFT_299567 [Macrolepiota fuliginosa MF-IS2]|uniref:NACHT domain-containing protein n=1 Tax=Macrolepiota fuliginosa MF-IS2 TaxID=1400762 RepID=A0A9P6BZ24_9AGAR|nr:hypothetical protein P691DRAFT_299567 [Macrolepiota fuliginosa MF-IS2]